MKKLNAVVAVEKTIKASTTREITDIYHKFQKSDLFNGFTKTYTPKDEESEIYAPENKKVICNASDMLIELSNKLTNLFDITLTKDVGNTLAKADIIVDGVTIAHDVPSTFIIFLEKQLVHIRTELNSIPTLDINEDWIKDTNSDLYKTESIETNKMKKVPMRFVKYEATKEHPAQVETLFNDVPVGTWNTIKQSGAMTIPDKKRLLNNIEKLINSVKVARETANSQEVESKQIGDAIFAYLLK